MKRRGFLQLLAGAAVAGLAPKAPVPAGEFVQRKNVVNGTPLMASGYVMTSLSHEGVAYTRPSSPFDDGHPLLLRTFEDKT